LTGKWVATWLCGLLAIATAGRAEIVRIPSGFDADFKVELRSTGPPSPQLGPGAFRLRLKVKYAFEDPAPISQISLRFSSRLALQMQGLPLCGLGELREASASGAVKVCAGAAVGQGKLVYMGGISAMAFATTEPLVAFNGRYRGRPAIFARHRAILGLDPRGPHASAISSGLSAGGPTRGHPLCGRFVAGRQQIGDAGGVDDPIRIERWGSSCAQPS
jgi:hypothetical protein